MSTPVLAGLLAEGDYHLASDPEAHADRDCPCGRAECGLVRWSKVSTDCDWHTLEADQAIGRIHSASSCPFKPKSKSNGSKTTGKGKTTTNKRTPAASKSDQNGTKGTNEQ